MTYRQLVNLIPDNLHWFTAMSFTMLLGSGQGSKQMMNAMVIKVLFDVYNIAGKPVAGKDLLDYLLPHLSIFERRYLSEHVFAVAFALLFLKYGVGRRDDNRLTARLSELRAQVEKLGAPVASLQEVERIAGQLNVVDAR